MSFLLPSGSCRRLLWLIAVAGLLAGCGGDDGPGSPPVVDDTIGPAGGTVTSADSVASLVVPAGALSSEVAITVVAAASPPAGVLAGTAYELGPAGTSFANPAELRITYDPATLPAGAFACDLCLCRLAGTVWLPVAASAVDSVEHVVSAALDHLSTYGIMSPGGNGEIDELTVYVLDDPDPGDETQFDNLADALDHLQANLDLEDLGIVVIQTDAPQQVDAMAFPFDLVLVVDDGFSGTLTGPGALPLRIDAAGAFELQDFAVVNAGGLVVNANRNLTLGGNTLPDETLVVIGGVKDARCPAREPDFAPRKGAERRAKGASIAENLLGDRFQLTWSGTAGYSGAYGVRENQGGDIDLAGSGPLGVGASLEVETNVLDRLSIGVKLEADAALRVTGQSGLQELVYDGTVDGTNPVEFTANSAATFNARVTGVGQLELKLHSAQGNVNSWSLDLPRVNWEIRELQYADVGIALLSAIAGSPEYAVDVFNATVANRFQIEALDSENGSLTLDIRGGSTFGELVLRAKYEGLYTLDHVTVRGFAEVAVHASVTDLTQSYLTYEGGVEFSAQGLSAGLYVQDDHSTYQDNVSFVAPPTLQFGLRIDESAFLEGGVFYISGGDKEPAAGGATREPLAGPVAGRSKLAIPEEIRLERLTWHRTGYHNMEIYDVDLPVIVDRCQITQDDASTAALTLMEIATPVTISNNQFHGSGITLQEVTGAVDIRENEFDVSTFMAMGINVGDCGPVSVSSNIITVAADGNGFVCGTTNGLIELSENSIDGSQGIAAVSIGGGIVYVENSPLLSGMVMVVDGLLRLTGNTCSNCTVNDMNLDGGLLVDPTQANSGLAPEQVFTHIDWDGNGCCDYPPFWNERIEGTCVCDGVPPPGG